MTSSQASDVVGGAPPCKERAMSDIDTSEPIAIRGQLAIDGLLPEGAVVIVGSRIEDVLIDPHEGDLPRTVLTAAIIAPGLIDLQVNGAFGVEVGDDPDAYRVLASHLPETGVTAYLPTIISSPPGLYPAAFTALTDAGSTAGATSLGFHLEGPFLSLERAGAHPPGAIADAPDELLDLFLADDRIRLVTLAPERDGGLERIRRLRGGGIVVSVGHTNGTYEEARAGFNAGATMATHLFNAMSPFGHRAPGAAGAALLDDRIVVGLIADGIHTHPAALEVAYRLKGVGGIALVSDMMAAAGMPPGTYPLGSQTVTTDGVSARLPDGTLAGSLLTMDVAIRNMVAWTDAGPAQAIAMATETPANVLGITHKGHLRPGADADLAFFTDDLFVTGTMIGGQMQGDALQPKTPERSD
jgi:N-acetylglucosamine-6-phosphate deacetylase